MNGREDLNLLHLITSQLFRNKVLPVVRVRRERNRIVSYLLCMLSSTWSQVARPAKRGPSSDGAGGSSNGNGSGNPSESEKDADGAEERARK